MTPDSESAAAIAEIEQRGVPPRHAVSVESARRIEDELFTASDPPPVAAVTDVAVDGPGRSIPLRVYRPSETPAPTLIFCHGGRWTLGTLDSADGICRRFCRRVGAVVVSVDYRLAPEYPSPAALRDAIAAVRWVDERGRNVGGDGTIGVAGSSAGGGWQRVCHSRPRGTTARSESGWRRIWRHRRWCIRHSSRGSTRRPTRRTPTARC